MRAFKAKILFDRRPTSIKTRIETYNINQAIHKLSLIADRHPLKQGLKRNAPPLFRYDVEIADRHPLKQGLKIDAISIMLEPVYQDLRRKLYFIYHNKEVSSPAISSQPQALPSTSSRTYRQHLVLQVQVSSYCALPSSQVPQAQSLVSP